MRIAANLEISIQIIEKPATYEGAPDGETRFYIQVYENDRATYRSAVAILSNWISDTLRSQGGY